MARVRGWPSDLDGVVTFPDGRRVRGRALRDGDPREAAAPDLGVYLTARRPEPSPWESVWIRWPDFRLPHDVPAALSALVGAYERAATTRVELACGGGIGRTGTAIALLARLAGVPADEAVDWTRRHYRPRAVEMPWQRRFVRRFDPGAGRGA